MIVAEDEMCGSIGGGAMEVRLAELAKVENKKDRNKSAIRDPHFQIVEQVHQKKSPDSSGMICSGRQTVFFYRLDSSHLKTVQKLSAL
jgi:xanthine/CO dehydrogenase XdhC/CoxF family maturation factor